MVATTLGGEMAGRKSDRRFLTMDKGMVIFLIFFGIITMCNGVPVNADTRIARNANQPSEICETLECVLSAASILEKMDLNIHPCDDFYAFACGNYIANQDVPDGVPSISTFQTQLSDLQSKLRRVLTDNNDNDVKFIKDLKNLYNLCMNEGLREMQGKAPLEKILNKLGGWPVSLGDKWNPSSFNWSDSMVKHRKFGLHSDAFMSIDIRPDLWNSSKLIIHIDESASNSYRRKMLPDAARRYISAFLQYMTNTAVILGADKVEASKEMEQVFQFFSKLVTIRKKPEEYSELFVPNTMTIRELSNTFPTIPWKDLMNRFFGHAVTILDDDIVNVSDPNYLRNLLELLHRTPKRVQANYIIWNDILNLSGYLTQDIQNEKLFFERKVISNSEKRNWKTCITEVSQDLPISMGSLFIRKYLQNYTKKNVNEIVGNIREAFHNMLKEIDWMDEVTKQKALEKEAAITSLVAYPEELFNDTIIEKFYANLTINSKSYLEAHLSINIFKRHDLVEQFRRPVEKIDWTMEGDVVQINAYYNWESNRIVFPAAFLNGALYNPARPKYLNYGGMGFVVGHELTHGFDSLGQSFDKYGNVHDWWDPNTKAKFVEKTKCIIDQYGKYNVTEVDKNINGILTLGENIADNGGVKAAYLAYSEWLNRNGNELKLPGLNYTNHQMFWISSANVWCGKTAPDVMVVQMLQDTHSPAEFRVMGSLTNRPEFAKDFGCSLGSNMNPKDKCSVW